MTFRGIIRNGEIVLPEGVVLPEGTEVDVQPVKKASAQRKRSAKASGKTGRRLPGFGLWKDRADLTDSVEFVKQLRATSRARRAHG